MSKKKKFDYIKYFLEKLTEHNYKYLKSERELYDFYEIWGNCIRGGFCTKHDPNIILESSHKTINGQVAIDHKLCFDKWRKCCLIIPIPKTKTQIEWLIGRFKFWGSEEGEKVTGHYCYDLYDTEYPNDL